MFTKKSDTIYRGELPKKGVLDSADLSGVCQKSVIVFFREGGGGYPNAHYVYRCNIQSHCIQSNLYKTTTLGITQKWSSWAGGIPIKHLYKMTTNQVWSFLAGLVFFSR